MQKNFEGGIGRSRAEMVQNSLIQICLGSDCDHVVFIIAVLNGEGAIVLGRKSGEEIVDANIVRNRNQFDFIIKKTFETEL